MGAFGVMRWGRPGGSQGRVAYLNKKVGLVEKTFGILATGAVFPVLDYLCVPGRVGRALQTLLGRAGIFFQPFPSLRQAPPELPVSMGPSASPVARRRPPPAGSLRAGVGKLRHGLPKSLPLPGAARLFPLASTYPTRAALPPDFPHPPENPRGGPNIARRGGSGRGQLHPGAWHPI